LWLKQRTERAHCTSPSKKISTQYCLAMVSIKQAFVVLIAALSTFATEAGSVAGHLSAARKQRVVEHLQLEEAGLRGPTQQQRLYQQQLEQPNEAWKPAFLAALNTNLHNRADQAGSGEGEGGGKKQGGPISVQVPEEEIDELMLRFSDKCRHRMNNQMEGKGTQLHTFGGPTGNASKANCDALKGTLCDTQAHVEQERDMPNKRKMTQTVDVTGKGCLPSECMSAPDLEALARFMHGQAKDQVPGMGVAVELNVDCTSAGGHSVLIKDGPQQRSSAATYWPQWSASVASLLAVVLHA